MRIISVQKGNVLMIKDHYKLMKTLPDEASKVVFRLCETMNMLTLME